MGSIDLENFPTSGSALRMLDDVSAGFYEKSYVGKWLFQVMGLEYDDAFRLVEELPKQFFPETASWGLKYHEIKWQLPVREYLPYEERRRLIYRKRDYRAPMTPYRMEMMVKNATGLDVYIADCHDPGKFGFPIEHPNIFRVDIAGGATQEVIIKALKLLNEIKQSHTTYGIYHNLVSETAVVKVVAGGSIGAVLKVKAHTVDQVRVGEALHVMADAVMGEGLRIKAALPKQIYAQGKERILARVLETNILKVKRKAPEKSGGLKTGLCDAQAAE